MDFGPSSFIKNLSKYNKVSKVIKKWLTFLYPSTSAAVPAAPLRFGVGYKALIFEEDAILAEIDGLSALKVVFGNGWSAPLFPRSTQYHNFKFGFGSYKQEPLNQLTEVRYKLYADSAPSVTGTFTLDSIFKS